MIENGKEVYRPRATHDEAEFLYKARTYGIDKLTEIMNPDSEEDLPFFLDFEDGEIDLPSSLIIDHRKTLVLSDIHLGFHDRDAIETAIKFGRKSKVDAILLNGDILDFYGLSRFDKLKSNVTLRKEIRLARELFRLLRQTFPEATIYYKEGNHEERFGKELNSNNSTLKELSNLEEMSLEYLLHCDVHKVQKVHNRQLIQLGKLNIYHGHEIGGGGVHVAAGLVNKTNSNILCGHWHKTQTATKTRLNDYPIAGFAVGCLCKLNPYWLPNNQWNHGFAMVEKYNDGTFTVENLRIINGKAM